MFMYSKGAPTMMSNIPSPLMSATERERANPPPICKRFILNSVFLWYFRDLVWFAMGKKSNVYGPFVRSKSFFVVEFLVIIILRQDVRTEFI